MGKGIGNSFRTTVLPAILFTCETWSTTKRDEEKFAGAERAMGRKICGVTRVDQLSNEEMRYRNGVKDAIFEIYAAKWRRAGHVERNFDNGRAYRLTDWIPRDRKRPLGRPQSRWGEPPLWLYGHRWKERAQNGSEGSSKIRVDPQANGRIVSESEYAFPTARLENLTPHDAQSQGLLYTYMPLMSAWAVINGIIYH